ncbi:MAG: hypothetical protein V1776_01690 [Candidatus Diapherotrites archaeon]
MDENTRELTPAEREKLLKELRDRLREIDQMKRALHLDEGKSSTEEMEKEEDENKNSEHVRAAVEELKVPSLEILQDSPSSSKKKKGENNASESMA